MRYGYFDDEHREYVITRPDTPLPWLNYLGTDAYVGIISNTAGGYSCYRDARLRRLTRYRYNGVPPTPAAVICTCGTTARVSTGRRRGSPPSATWTVTSAGTGCPTPGSRLARLGVRAETLYFVPPGETLEVWRLRVRNERGGPADLSVFSSVEFCLWDAQDDATNFQRNYSTGEVEVDGGVIYHKTEYRERRDHFAYFACSEPLAGFDTQREEFLGPYRGWDRPLAVERGESANSVAHGWAPHGSHHVRFLLAPGETKEVIFLLGYWENPREAKFDPPGSQILNKALVRPVIDRWLRPETVAEGFRQLRESWSSRLSVLQVGTPDQDTNRMVNIWNPYQCMVTFAMSRSVSLFESGISRGIGFRDSCQDLLGFVQLAPGRARARILDLAATQLASGGAYHQYQPLTKTRQRRHRLRVQRRSALAGARRRRLPQGDWRRGDPGRTGSLRRRGGRTPAAAGAPGAVTAVHAGPARPASAAAHRPGRLERLPEPQLLLGRAGAVVPDHGERGRRHR